MKRVILCAFLLFAALKLLGQTTADQLDGNNTSGCYTSGGHCQKAFQPMTNTSVTPPDTYNIIPGNVSRISIKNLLYGPGTSQATKDATKVFAHLLGWFCVNPDPTKTTCEGHVHVGYSSDDAAPGGTVETQLKDMRDRGFDGVVIDWYGVGGQRNTNDLGRDSILRINRTAGAVKQVIPSISPLQFALMEDQGGLERISCLFSNRRHMYSKQHY